MISGRRLFAHTLHLTGVLRALELTRGRPALIVVNHHRIGDSSATLFDRGVFSSTQEQLDQQIGYLRRNFPIVWGDHLHELVSGRRALKRTNIAITFDDGYLDNYRLALPVLNSHRVGAAFFLVSDYVGSSAVPWWDEIAYLLRQTKERELNLVGVGTILVPPGRDREPMIRKILRVYKHFDERSAARLLLGIREQTQCALPAPKRRFLNWQEARDMARAGMVIGSHTRSHRVLGRLSREEQERELVESRREIEERTGLRVSSLAYPVGTRGSFSAVTEQIARSAGYTICFSFYGGRNLPGNTPLLNVRRNNFSSDGLLFRTETVLHAFLGRAPF